MKLLADSGSTKTDWCVLGSEPIKRITTKGTNPFFQSEEEMSLEIETALLPQLPQGEWEAVHFYGAGCAFPDKIEQVRRVLCRHLRVRGEVEVCTDMLAAARALCGREVGIACILGTGSNSCLYDGERIVSNVSPLGFILGDEGSGAVLGKLLVGDILKNQTTPELKEKFLARFGLTPADIIERVYRRPFPNRFLASLSPFLAENLGEPSIRRLVLNSFKAFFERNVRQYEEVSNANNVGTHPGASYAGSLKERSYLSDLRTHQGASLQGKPKKSTEVHFIGSIAYYYKDILAEAARETGFTIGTIIQSPMEGLIKYHSY